MNKWTAPIQKQKQHRTPPTNSLKGCAFQMPRRDSSPERPNTMQAANAAAATLTAGPRAAARSRCH